ncbi:MAG: DUF4340 domain-containing protein [Cyclobacteriaceae bacterium]
MLKNLSNLKLLLLMGGLLVVYLIVEWTGQTSRSTSYREVSVEIDTAKVTRLLVKAPDKVSDMSKVGEGWELTLPTGKKVEATEGSVKSSLGSLLSIKPSRLVAKKQDKWKDYQVDSAGTAVEVYEGGEKTLDLIIGRFNMEGQNSYSTFVRLAGEDEVYSAKNFMAFSVSADPAAYRNSVLMRTNKDSIQQVTFNYPDSAFVLTKESSGWSKNGQPADSASVASFIGGLSFVSSRTFFDETDQLVTPEVSVTIESTNSEVEVKAFEVNGEWILNSSENPESYFNDQTLVDKLLKPSSGF